MRTSLYVISDLHLGGEPAGDGGRGFQICPPRTQQLLAGFIDGLPGRSAEADVRLVIAGDIVDFLAEAPFEAFTADPAVARRKLASILENTAPVWSALQRFARDRDGAMTLMLGNHDIELSLPGTRQLLLERIGPGRIDFIYDNEAFTCGPVLIEHGNRFDAWNAVPHGALRRVRSQLSRALDVRPPFPALPGSRLVVDVMNPLKRQYPFIDLLKPENAGALPIAAALGAGGVREVWQAFQRFRQTWSADYDENREPLDEEFVHATRSEDQDLFDLAEEIAAGGAPTQVSAAGDLLRSAGAALSDAVRRARREALFKAFSGTLGAHTDAFDIGKELDTYLVPARRAAGAGFKVVVYGHTHLAKRIALADDDPETAPRYLNTGTWADLMRVPQAVWDGEEKSRRAALAGFVDDLERGALDAWRRGVPTYARIELDGDAVGSADVYFADGKAGECLSTDGLLQRLAGGAVDAGR